MNDTTPSLSMSSLYHTHYGLGFKVLCDGLSDEQKKEISGIAAAWVARRAGRKRVGLPASSLEPAPPPSIGLPRPSRLTNTVSWIICHKQWRQYIRHAEKEAMFTEVDAMTEEFDWGTDDDVGMPVPRCHDNEEVGTSAGTAGSEEE